MNNRQTDQNEQLTDSSKSCPVNSWNEWDPLEEVIVGNPLGAYVNDAMNPVAEAHPTMLDDNGNLHWHAAFKRAYEGTPYPINIAVSAYQQIENFISILKSEGVVVRRPEVFNLGKEVSTPFWNARSGYNFMNARDLVMIVGNQIIESPTPIRSRYFETLAYRRLFNDYHKAGAKWISAPKPALPDSLYDCENVHPVPDPENPPKFMINELEPVFDAASFIRCGRDIFAVRDNVTNYAGIDWLRQYLGDEFRVHVIECKAPNAMHIDDIFVPLAPGKAMVNPAWDVRLPDITKSWDLFMAPPPNKQKTEFMGFPSAVTSWISMNVFSIDEERVFVEEQQVRLIRKLKDWGFKPIPIPFSTPPMLGGGIHCSTLDIRRCGTLQSYF